MSTGIKHDQGKEPLSLIPTQPLMLLGRVLAYGATKYSPQNWRGGMAWSRLIDATLRHVVRFNGGEDVDPETGISHLAHAACNLFFLMEYYQTHPELDDRFKKVGCKDGT